MFYSDRLIDELQTSNILFICRQQGGFGTFDALAYKYGFSKQPVSLADLARNSTPLLRQNCVLLISVNSSAYHRAIGLIQLVIYFSMHRLLHNACELS